MIKKLLLILSVLSVGSADLLAQDPGFTQFYANPLYLNPAFAGTARCPRICMNYRNEWPGLNNAYITYSASYDQHVDNLSGGIGLLATSDRAGDGTLTTNRISGIYSYQLNPTREFSLKFALEGTYHQKSLDWSKLTFGDMIDRRRGFVWNTNEIQVSNKSQGIDVSAGMLGYSKRYFFGFAAHHINQPEEGFIQKTGVKLPIKFTGHAGAMIPLEKGMETYISPNILYQRQQDFQQLNLGLYFVKNQIVGGVWYRNQDAFIVLIGLQTKSFKIGYSYDVTISKLANVSAGSHELSMQLQFQCRPKHRKFRTVSCPSF
ncbi:MAG: type IX secretion system membrane protein PorP/SprF [Bacteroidetes bacterium]|jgi:type IX secretion system PorP/SprF family membrane protein|nr:type IX secretion system membrane protein PorP/SprF [Bacteroidota bacterium]